jgi:hypothetical protein
MARVETAVRPTLSAMASDLSRMKSKLNELDDLLHEEAPAIAPLQELAAIISSWPNWTKSIPLGGDTIRKVNKFVKAMGGFKTATGTARDALSSINDKINYLNSVRSALRKRVKLPSIESDCNATSDKPMVEHVCTSYGINYRRMMKGREGTTAAWNEPCNTFSYTTQCGRFSETNVFKHPPSFALSYARLPLYYHQSALELLHENQCQIGECGKGPTQSLYGEGSVGRAVNTIEGFLTTSTATTEGWGRAAAEIEDDIKIYNMAIKQAIAQLNAAVAVLDDKVVKTYLIQLSLVVVHAMAAALATTVPVLGWIGSAAGEAAAQSAAYYTWGQMIKKIKKSITKVKNKKKSILRKAEGYWAKATTRWIDADDAFDELRVSGGALVYAQRGIVNFKKALPKRSLCNPIYPTRKAGAWAKLAGYSSAAEWSSACPVLEPYIRARCTIPLDRTPTSYRPGDAPGPGEIANRLRDLETETERGERGEYGALTAEPTTILGMKPWQAVLLAAGAYWLWTERK